MLSPRRSRPTLFVTLALLLGACSLEPLVAEGDQDPTARTRPPVELEQQDSAAADSDLTKVIKAALPSVVNVRVRSVREGSLFGEEQQGQGSGVIIDPQGVILTNNHVVAGAREVEVAFNDEREPLKGEVLGAVPERDLAVVQVEADDLPAIDLGRSDQLELGQQVIAIGFPLGLGGPTVTQGIISGLERTINVTVDVPGSESVPVSLEGLLQTDAAINPGNSGGALIDAAGRLVGVNTAAAQAASAENVGFAISIDSAVPVIEQILEGPDQAWLGVQLVSIHSATLALEAGFEPDARGALVWQVFEGSPAAEEEIPTGALIVELAGHRVESADDVTETLIDLQPGDEIDLELLFPDGGTRRVSVELGLRPRTQLPAPG